MKLIKPSFTIESDLNYLKMLGSIERAGRTCYKSEDKITKESAEPFVRKLIKSGHESVLEHQSFSVRFICDRGVSHELVRHRIASFSQESTRYCNYGNDEHIQFIIPNWLAVESGIYEFDSDSTVDLQQPMYGWVVTLIQTEQSYNELINVHSWTPQQARSVLPNSLKTEIVVTANIREWRTILKQRTSKAAHPQMRELMIPLLEHLKLFIPVFFEDL